MKMEKKFDEEEFKFIKPDYSLVKKEMQVVSANSLSDENVVDWKPQFNENGGDLVLCPFCKGTGQGRHLVEIYCQDGASFLKDTDRTGWTYGYWQYSYSIPAHPMWFNSEEIIYMMENPRSMSVYGWADMQSALEHVKILEESVRHNMALLTEAGVPAVS